MKKKQINLMKHKQKNSNEKKEMNPRNCRKKKQRSTTSEAEIEGIGLMEE